MRAVVQRVRSASVVVDGEVVGRCGAGFLVLVAAHKEDKAENAVKMADRIWGMRIMPDDQGRINVALKSYPGASVLAVSQFTLYGDASQRRPSFVESASFEAGKELFDRFVSELRALGCPVETGVFGAHMDIQADLDGPVTILTDC